MNLKFSKVAFGVVSTLMISGLGLAFTSAAHAAAGASTSGTFRIEITDIQGNVTVEGLAEILDSDEFVFGNGNTNLISNITPTGLTILNVGDFIFIDTDIIANTSNGTADAFALSDILLNLTENAGGTGSVSFNVAYELFGSVAVQNPVLESSNASVNLGFLDIDESIFADSFVNPIDQDQIDNIRSYTFNLGPNEQQSLFGFFDQTVNSTASGSPIPQDTPEPGFGLGLLGLGVGATLLRKKQS